MTIFVVTDKSFYISNTVAVLLFFWYELSMDGSRIVLDIFESLAMTDPLHAQTAIMGKICAKRGREGDENEIY